MFKIQTLNKISSVGLSLLPLDNYESASEISHPDAILVRSFKMHDMEMPESLLAIGRAIHRVPMPMRLRNSSLPAFSCHPGTLLEGYSGQRH